MAFYGKTSRAVQDGARNSRTEQLKQQVDWNTLVNPTPAQAAVQRDYQKQLENEAKWAAEQEEKRRQERVAEKEKYANPSPQAKARKAQEKADLQAGVGQQQDYSTAWQNLIGQPEDLVSNGQTIQNRQTGEQVSVPNRSQAQSQQRSAEPQTTPPQTPVQTPVTPTPVETAAPEPVEEETNTNVAPRTTTPVTQTATEEQQETAGEQPRTTTTTAPRTRGYERAEEPFLNGTSALVEDQTPLVRSPYTPYNPPTRREQNPADTNPAGLPSTPAQTYYDWQNYVAQLEAAERANDELFRQSVQPDTSVLGNGYVQPITINTNPSALAGAPDLFNGGSYLPATQTPSGGVVPNRASDNLSAYSDNGVGIPALALGSLIANNDAELLHLDNVIDYMNENDLPPTWLTTSEGRSFIEGSLREAGRRTGTTDLQGRDASPNAPYDYVADSTTGPRLPDSATPSFGDVINAIVTDTGSTPDTNAYIDTLMNRSNALDRANGLGARVVDESNYGTTPERRRALEVAQSMGLFGPEAVEYADYLVKNGGSLYRWSPNEDAIRSKAEEAYLDNLFETENEYELTQEQMNARRREAEAYANDVVNNYRVGTPGEQRYDARQGTGGQSSPLDQVLDDIMNGTAPGAGSTSTTTGTTTGTTPSTTGTTGRPQTYEEALAQYLLETGKNLIDLDEGDYMAIRKRTNNNNSSTQVQNVVATATANKPPKGSTTFTPSYGQDMKQGVKAPYKTGGYTEAEIRALGNRPYTDANGRSQYEGYYYWNGKWYPVDQEKAAYYQKYHTYDGWEEPMRDYYNTFGTFYGYRPDWKTAGRNVSSGTNSRPSYSTSYRSGSTNRGYYNSYYNNPVGNRGETNPTVANQQDQRINNIMKNWTF